MPDDAYQVSDQTIYATRQIVVGTAHTPFQGIDWPSHARSAALTSQLQQVKGAGTVPPIKSPPPTMPPGKASSAQGIPKNLGGISVTRNITNTMQAQIQVAFTANPNDPYFSFARIYLKQTEGNPTLIGQGPTSPIAITVNRTKSPSTILVQAAGNWGEIPLSSCPSASISLI